MLHGRVPLTPGELHHVLQRYSKNHCDTYVNSKQKGTAYFKDNDLRVGSPPDGTSLTDDPGLCQDGSDHCQRIFLDFPTGDFDHEPTKVLYAAIDLFARDADIDSADDATEGVPATFDLYHPTHEPAQSTTWDKHQPGRAVDKIIDTVEQGGTGHYIWDENHMAALVDWWFDKESKATGVRIEARDEFSEDAWRSFHSGNAESRATEEDIGVSQRPRLVVHYVVPPDPPENVSASAGNQAATVTWEDPADDGGQLTGFEVELKTADTHDVVATKSCSASCHEVTFTGLTNDQHYYGRVQAENEAGVSDWAASDAVRPHAPPETPTLVAPADGHIFGKEPVRLTASYVDPESDPGEVQFAVHAGSDCSSQIEAAWRPSSGWASSGDDVTFEGLPDLADGTYSWEARARDAYGATSGWSTCRSFSKDSTAATVAVDSASHPDANVWYADDSVELSWTPSDSDVSEYWYVVDQQPDTAPASGDSSTTSTSTTETVDGSGQYYFHIRAISTAGVKGDTSHFPFKVDVDDPDAPTAVVSPTHPAGLGSASRTMTFAWDPASDAHAGVAGYSYHLLAEDDVPVEPDLTVDTTDTTATVTLPKDAEEGIYYFHVRTIDAAETGSTDADGNGSAEAVYGPILYDSSSTTLPPSPTLDKQRVAQSDQLGLEQFFPVDRTALGTAEGFVNLGTGNVVVRQTDVNLPGEGLNTVVRRVYNAHRDDEDRHDVGLGLGWSLSVSDATAGTEAVSDAATSVDVNAPVLTRALLDVTTAEAGGRMFEFTDGDGTTHRFIREAGPDGRWHSPPGVNLTLQEDTDTTGGPTAYTLTRPDGVIYRIEPLDFELLSLPEWRLTTITDRDGNQLSFDYAAYGEVAGTSVRLESITHSRDGGTVAELTWTSDGVLQSVTGLPGHTAADPFDGTARSWDRITDVTVTDGRLTDAVHNTQTDTAGGRAATGFGYDPTTGELTEVTDGRGNTTAVGYTGQGVIDDIIDRRGSTWDYDVTFNDDGTVTTTKIAPGPNTGTWTYDISARGSVSADDPRKAGGNITSITDPGADDGPITDTYTWKANRLIRHVDGAGVASTTAYDTLGMVTTLTDPPPNAGSGLPAGAPTSPVDTDMVWKYSGKVDYAGCATAPATATSETADGACYTIADLTQTAQASNVAGQTRITDYTYHTRSLDGATVPNGNLATATQRATADGSSHSDDRTVTVDYYDSGAVKSVDGPRTDVADVTTYGDTTDGAFGGYHRSGKPTQLTDAAGATATFAYTPWGGLAEQTDRDGRTDRARFDDRGLTTTAVDPAGDTTRHRYDPNGNRAATVAPRGTETATAGDFETRYSYNATDQQTLISRPGAGADDPRTETATVYHPDGTVDTTTSPIGGVTEHLYWPNQLTRETRAPADSSSSPAVTSWRYDAAGRPDVITRPDTGPGRPTVHVDYTPAGNPAEVTRDTAAGDATTTTAYNAHREAIQTDGPRTVDGTTEQTTAGYDTFGQTTRVSRRLSDSETLDSTFDYDHAGNLTRTVRPSAWRGHSTAATTTFDYDILNQLIRRTDPHEDNHEITYGYTPAGLQTTRTDHDTATGTVLRKQHTAYNDDRTVAHRLTRDTDASRWRGACNYPGGTTAADGYDADGNLLTMRTVTAPEATDLAEVCSSGTMDARTDFTYDHRGWKTTTTQTVRSPADGQLVIRTQDHPRNPDGTWDSFTHGRRTVDYGYTAAGWVHHLDAWDNRDAWRFYTDAGEVSSIGHRSAGVDTWGFIDRHIDGSVAALDWQVDGDSIRTHEAVAYDRGGLRLGEDVTVTMPDGSTAAGRGSFAYDLTGRLTAWTSPYAASALDEEGSTTTYDLDDAGNIDLQQTRDTSGNMLQEIDYRFIDEQLDRKEIQTYSAPGVEGGQVTTDYTYDLLGQRIEQDLNTVGDTRLTCGICPTVDADEGITATDYDPQGHVQLVDEQTGTDAVDVAYVYDAWDRMVARTATASDGTEATFLYFYAAGTQTTVEHTDRDGNSVARYLVDGDGATYGQQTYATDATGRVDDGTDGQWSWLLHDVDGNVATIVTADGIVVEQAAYSPYGRPDQAGSGRTADSSAPHSQLGFQTAINDPDTGTVILGPRQYDPTTATFTSQDFFPAAGADRTLAVDPLTGNRYRFAASNPVAFHDDGHRPTVGTDTACTQCTEEQRHEGVEAWAQYARRRIGEGGCRRQSSPADAITHYLRGYVCAPSNFPYNPDHAIVPGGKIRLLDPYGECSDPLGFNNTGASFDFTNACLAHDYGYDLMRYLDRSGSDRRAVDSLFSQDLINHCRSRSWLTQGRCLHWADIYGTGVDAMSLWNTYSVPSGDISISK